MKKMRHFMASTLCGAVLALAAPFMAQAELVIRLDQPVVEPMPFALPRFVDEGGAGELAANLSSVIAADLAGTGMFEKIPEKAYIQKIGSFDAAVSYPDWQAINAQALVTGAVQGGGKQIMVKFCLHDVFANSTLGECLQFAGDKNNWRRVAHKVADAVYSRITGETGYFDSRIVFVAESGPKNQRQKRLAVADYDGAGLSYLTDSSSIVLAPRFSPTGDRILFTSYSTGFPQIYLMNVGNLSVRSLGEQPGTMTFAPRFSPDGRTVVFSLERGGNSDIYTLNISSGALTQLTNSPSIETAPSYSPDGSQIVFESDRSGVPQIYIMSAGGGEGRRISGGEGRYGTPVWSPRGDYIAFTKQNAGRFHIGVMLTDGGDEKLLTSSYLDEGPTWAPNGRVIMFTRQPPGAGSPELWSVDITGRSLRQVKVKTAASDPAWSPLLP